MTQADLLATINSYVTVQMTIYETTPRHFSLRTVALRNNDESDYFRDPLQSLSHGHSDHFRKKAKERPLLRLILKCTLSIWSNQQTERTNTFELSCHPSFANADK